MEYAKDYPIDAVVTWVDGNDPVHRAKRRQFEHSDEARNDDIGGDIRYTSVGEIKYCVLSILKNAPFIRHIYIVTDAQDPRIGDFIERNCPGGYSKVSIVDHKVLYRGYEHFLPIFNSLSIETVLWRIPGLSEHFIYLNDDFMIVSPTVPSDYFRSDTVVCYATWFSIAFARLLQWLKPKKNGHKVFTFKHSMVNAADVLGEKLRFFRLGHNPQSMRVSIFSDWFSSHPDIMAKNMSCRFREDTQFNPAELNFLLAAREGSLIRYSTSKVNLYLLPKDHDYMVKRIKRFNRSGSKKFCCLNSLDYASREDRDIALSWLERRLGCK